MGKTRIRTTIQNVGTDWVDGSVTKKPARYTITRARAIPTDGPATQVALRVKNSSTTGDQYIELEYELTPDYIDSAESIDFQSEVIGEAGTGTTYLQVKTDNATPSEITVILNIEY